MKLSGILIFCLFLLAGNTMYAEVSAEISSAEGNSFTITSDGVSTDYNLVSGFDVTGLSLAIGDTINTSTGTFVDLKITYRNNLSLRIAENTTFSIDALDEDGDLILYVPYGRILAETHSSSDDSHIWITGFDTYVRAQKGLYGYEVFYNPSSVESERETLVYSFDGDLEVIQFADKLEKKSDLLNKEPFIVSTDTMTRTKSQNPDTSLLNWAIEQEIIEFWFGKQEEDLVIPEIAEETSISEDLELDPVYVNRTKFQLAGKITIASGIGLMMLGGIIRAVAPNNSAIDPLFTSLMVIGGVATGVGAGLIIYSFSPQ